MADGPGRQGSHSRQDGHEKTNYEKLVDLGRERFLEKDQDAMAARLGLETDADALFIDVLGRRVRVRREDGRAFMDDTGEPASANIALFVYDLLGHTPDPVVLAHEWASLAQLSGMQGGAVNAQDFFAKYKQAFDGHAADLARACEKLGGTPAQDKADVAFVVPACVFVPVYFKFYESDEEFPAQLTMLCDANTNKYLYYETIWYLLVELCGRIGELAGLGSIGVYNDGAPSGGGFIQPA